MKIYEVTGKIRENPQPPNMQPGKVVKQTGNELTVATQAQGQPTGTELTVDLSKNPQAIQKDPQGNITIDPNAKPEPSGGMQLQPGQQINVASAPGGMLPNKTVSGQPQQVQQDQAAAEDMENMKKLAGIKEQPTTANQIPTSLTVAGMLNNPEVDSAMKPQLQKLIVANPDGTVNLAQTMRKASGEFYNTVPELIEVLQSLAQQAAAFVKSPEFSELGPQDQNSIINLAKTLPGSLQQMQAQITKGAQAHDAGFNKMDAATGQYGDGQVEEADAGETTGQDIPPMPDISGLQPGQAKDLGGGQKVTIAPDGNVHLTGAFGSVVYSPQGKPLSYDTPNFGGAGMKQDFSTGNTTRSYSAGPLSTSQTKNAQGQIISSKGTFTVGDGSHTIDQAYKDGQPTIQTRTGTGSQANTPYIKNQAAYDKAMQAQSTEDYVPTGYNDKNREKAMMRKAMQSITADNQFISESNDIVALAKKIANVPIKASSKQKQDIINLKRLAGL